MDILLIIEPIPSFIQKYPHITTPRQGHPQTHMVTIRKLVTNNYVGTLHAREETLTTVL